ncbi:NAD(P)/FAD-dependent oxidoreductase [Lachnotalea sp. AF33-28]|uniref:NAD(P)/FAD-dependent oxidoreductase n=1 Tax=Lachnotalea sp. AF33-28 TaxID=2292046 RepID=UPI000E53A13C|nr:FAD-dependent oxidoreductase [Lachnotalea sp. AF33-28]RHP30523.1 FAD-dependent oxidoreductase [Lachnotalea sp. AF33-28]
MKEYDIIIIGAGPAGISASIYAVSRGKSTLVIEKDRIGGLIGKVSTVTHYSAIMEEETGGTFAARLEAQARGAGVEFLFAEVTAVSLEGECKEVTAGGQTYKARRLILANGTTPRKLGIPGEEKLFKKGVGGNATKDGAAFTGKHIYVVGGADGAVKEALYLARFADKLTIIHFEEKLGTIPEFLRKVEAADNIEVLLNTRLTAVSGEDRVESLTLTDIRTGEVRTVNDSGCGIFIYAGSTPNTGLYAGLSLKDGYIAVNDKMETSIPGVYAAGDICVKQVRQAATAVADGAVAAINAAM